MSALTSSQLYLRARILLISALLVDFAAFGIVVGKQSELINAVLWLLLLSAVLFVASIVVRRAGDRKLVRRD